MRNKVVSVIIIVVIAVLLVASFTCGYRQAKKDIVPEERVDTIHKVDTFVMSQPKDTITLVKWKTYQVHDTAVMTHHDTTYVMLPYEQHMLSVKDTLDLWFSGVDARVDSLRILLHSSTITSVTTIKDTPRPNTIGVIGGMNDLSFMYTRHIGRISVGATFGSTYDGRAVVRGFVGWNF